MTTFFLDLIRTENDESFIDNSIEVISATKVITHTPGFCNVSFNFTRTDRTAGNCWNDSNGKWEPRDFDGHPVEVPGILDPLQVSY